MQASLQEQNAELRKLRNRDRREVAEFRDKHATYRANDRVSGRRRVAALVDEVAELKDKLGKIEGTNNKRKLASDDDDVEDERRVKARRFIQGLKGG